MLLNIWDITKAFRNKRGFNPSKKLQKLIKRNKANIHSFIMGTSGRGKSIFIDAKGDLAKLFKRNSTEPNEVIIAKAGAGVAFSDEDIDRNFLHHMKKCKNPPNTDKDLIRR